MAKAMVKAMIAQSRTVTGKYKQADCAGPSLTFSKLGRGGGYIRSRAGRQRLPSLPRCDRADRQTLDRGDRLRSHRGSAALRRVGQGRARTLRSSALEPAPRAR